MQGVLNEVTRTVHKHERASSDLETRCGATYRVDHDHLRMTPVEQATSVLGAKKCGRCFADSGGY